MCIILHGSREYKLQIHSATSTITLHTIKYVNVLMLVSVLFVCIYFGDHSKNKTKLHLVLERTPKYRTSNTPNIELSEHHILA